MQSFSPSICHSCRRRLLLQLPLRPFSTSKERQAIPPESPHYIDVPQSHQPELVLPRQPKGVLPVPKELFPANKPDKRSLDYLKKVTPDKAPHNLRPLSEMGEWQQHKARMGQLRKSHLREGLVTLHKRKEFMSDKITARSEAKQAERDRLISQKQREDDRLTAVSTPQSMLLEHGARLVQTDDTAIYERKRTNIEKHAERKAEERRNALHSLYMNARTFITDEEQLTKAIEEEFSENKFRNEWRTGDGDSANIWNLGPPPTVAEMLEETQARPRREQQPSFMGNVMDMNRKHEKDQERLRRIAEELSGGKM